MEDKLKNGKKKIIILFIVLATILLGVSTFGCVYAYKSNKNDVENTKGKKENTNDEEEIKAEDMTNEYTMSDNALSAFDLYFMKKENKNENMVYSPISIKYMLSMLADAANDQTKNELNRVLGNYNINKYSNNKNISFNNTMFIKDAFKDYVKADYKKLITNKYNGEVIFDSFANANNINKKISENTLNLINDLIDDSRVKDANFFLVNALALDMYWNYRIQAAANSDVPVKNMIYTTTFPHEKHNGQTNFDYIGIVTDDNYESLKFNHSINAKAVKFGSLINNYDIVKELGEENIRKEAGADLDKFCDDDTSLEDYCTPEAKQKTLDDYIETINKNYHVTNVSTDYRFNNNKEVKMFAKELQPVDGLNLEYIAIMPKKENLSDFISNMDASKISDLVNSLKEVKSENFDEGKVYKITGSVPLFKMEYSLDLEKDLKGLGINKIFKIEQADLSNLTDDHNAIAIDNEYKIEFSNDGIKAAAATSGGGMGDATAWDYFFEVPVEVIDLTFDKPFMYLIRNKDTNEIWFAGTVYEPIKNNK